MNYPSNIEFRLIKPIIEEVYTIGEDRILKHIEYQESYDFDKYFTEKVNRIITQYKKDHSVWTRMLKYIKKIYILLAEYNILSLLFLIYVYLLLLIINRNR
jgi:hypothetical protein